MACVRKRLVVDRSKRYDVVYRDLDGRQRWKTHRRKIDADGVCEHSGGRQAPRLVHRPQCGEGDRQGLRGDLAGAQTFDPSTREAVEGRFRRHVHPQLGGRRFAR